MNPVMTMRMAGRRRLRRLLQQLLRPSGAVRHWGWEPHVFA